MSEKSNIQWTDATWNIARGCTKVDADCKFCYMYRDSFNASRYDPLQVVRTKTVFDLPMRLKTPSKIFTCSLTDFFHTAIDPYRGEAWEIIKKCPQHTFQILTKRPERILKNLPADFGDKYRHVQFGTSVGSQASVKRIRDLIEVKSYWKLPLFLSLEPLHGPVDLDEKFFTDIILNKGVPIELKTKLINLINWVIIGGESGNETGKYRYRPCKLEWIQQLVSQCKAAGVPVFVKQMGTHLAKELGMSDRHGGDIEEFPEGLQIREFPL